MTTRRISDAVLPTRSGTFLAVAFRDDEGNEHLALCAGLDPESGRFGGDAAVLVRLHSECLTGDLFGSMRCDCQAQLHAALDAVQASGRGAVLYLRGHEGRGIGLAAKISAYRLQDGGLDTYDANEALGFPADARNFAAAAEMLELLGVGAVHLISNNPRKIEALRAAGLDVAERVPALSEPTEHNEFYLRTKQSRGGHTFENLVEAAVTPI
jgi:3,4-dihydroxy 2-butanone 4-phosphate synthase/GTP cyclohydrolase II